jgi:tRNA(Ile2) C34 agmatinyltransferase TiaS
VLYIGLDDTDNLESRGTGHLARQIASALAVKWTVLGVTRHQLLVDPRVPYTKNNSSSVIMLRTNGASAGRPDVADLTERVRALMLADYQPGSDPGLCVARSVPASVTEFGRRVQQDVVTQDEARALAAAHGISLHGLGGDHGGIIGALAAVGLAASGEDGRYVLVGRSRELIGLQPISAILDVGIAAVQTLDGQPVSEGMVQIDRLRPARRGERPVLVVECAGEHWRPLKLD